MSTATQLSVEAIAFSTLARTVSLSLFGLGVWRVRLATDGNDDFAHARGLRNLWTAMALGVGGLSLAGLPGTLGFVARWAVTRAYGPTDAEGLVLMLVASASVGVGMARGLIALYSDPLPDEAALPPIVGDQLALFANDSPVAMPIENADDGAALDSADAGADDSETNAAQPTAGDTASGLDSAGARFRVGTGVALVLILGLWPGVIAPLAQAVAAQYSIYR